MVCLERKVIPKGVIQKFEAPEAYSTALDRQRWAYTCKPFFDDELVGLWNVYTTDPALKYATTSHDNLVTERRDFIRHPAYVASQNGQVVGGAWVDTVTGRRQTVAEFHIIVQRESRSLAQPLLDAFVDNYRKKYDVLRVGWGKRNGIDDPTKFFERNGFTVQRFWGLSTVTQVN